MIITKKYFSLIDIISRIIPTKYNSYAMKIYSFRGLFYKDRIIYKESYIFSKSKIEWLSMGNKETAMNIVNTIHRYTMKMGTIMTVLLKNACIMDRVTMAIKIKLYFLDYLLMIYSKKVPYTIMIISLVSI